jgi:hypothetical protein
MDIQPAEPAAVVFGGKRDFSFKVDAVIINEDGKTIASGSITLNSKNISFSSGDRNVTAPAGSIAVFRFQNVNANDMTENLVIRIAKIDGIDAGTAGEKGYIRIAAESKAGINQIESSIELARIEAKRMELSKIYPRESLPMTMAELQRVEDANNGFHRADFTFTIKSNTVEIKEYNGSIKDVIIPSKINNMPVTSIGDLSFDQRQITSVIIPYSVTSIGYSAFISNQLTSVTIPNSVTYIGERAFRSNRLTSVTIPDSVTYIGSTAFWDNRLISITFPWNIIGNLPFDNRSFNQVYSENGRQGGTYVKRNGTWVKQ